MRNADRLSALDAISLTPLSGAELPTIGWIKHIQSIRSGQIFLNGVVSYEARHDVMLGVTISINTLIIQI